MIQIVHMWLLWGGFALLALAIIYRWYSYKPVRYVMPYAALIERLGKTAQRAMSYTKLIFLARVCALILILLATAQVRHIDEQSKIEVQGSDIMLVLDASGSMQLFDDLKDPRSRFEVAKKEVLNFINRRPSDPIGLVIFGATAVSRCPVTLDKRLLHDLVSELALGDINHGSTVLGVALAMAVSRLRHSTATSKIVILLTDGAPTDDDVPVEPAIELAKKYGVKVYTIGVGGADGGYAHMPLYGLMRCETPLNIKLLNTIAQETGGAFFHAEKPDDIRRVYEIIDSLEKTSYDVPLYSRYNDLFVPLLVVALLLLAFEIILRWWRIVL